MRNMKVRTKIIIAILIIDLLALLSLGAGYYTVFSIYEYLNENRDIYGLLRSYHVLGTLLVVIDIIVIPVVSIIVPRMIRKNVDNLSYAAKEIANGNVYVKLKKKANDEFGQLIDDYQKVIDGMRNQVDVAAQVAEGDFTKEFVEKSEADELSATLNLLTRRNSEAIADIKNSSMRVKSNASQVASASDALAQGATEQASAIQEITASINEVARKTKQNATEAEEASRIVTDVMQDVVKGNEQMQEMKIAMKEINEASENISKIIKVIDDIAFQTNILALNAAVEAARAGEAGKGFSVVAEEVRNLAAKSAQAAAETAELIENSIIKVDGGSRIATETAEALETITEAVQRSENIIVGIAEASNQQAAAIEQIDQAITQVSQVVETTSATSEECASASEELFNQADAVLELLAVYKLKNNI